MKKTLINIAYGAYLGGMLSFIAGLHWNNLGFYLILIPTAILVEMRILLHKR